MPDRYKVKIEHSNPRMLPETFHGISRTRLPNLLRKIAWVKQIILTPEKVDVLNSDCVDRG